MVTVNVNLTHSGIHAEIAAARETTQRALPKDVTLHNAILVESPDMPGLGVYEVWFSCSDLMLAHVTIEGQLVRCRDLDLEDLQS